MANITLDLNKFTASGVYTVEIAPEDSITLNTQTVRLVVGFSRKGVFNAPVFLKDIKDAKTMFGAIDKTLEQRGSFFHRSLFTALQTGPVYALNLLALDNRPDGDLINYRSMSLDTVEDNGDLTKSLLASFYNKERFWKPDEKYFQAIVNSNANNNGKLMSFVNLSQQPVSVFVKKANVNGFDITARDFYGNEDVPPYVRPFDYLADYFVDVIVVKGNWTDYASLAIDPTFSQFFDERGLKTNQLDNFLSNDIVIKIATLQGSIIPDFTDGNNVNHSIDTIVNNASALTGVHMTLNRLALDDYENSNSKIDVIGHNLVGSSRTNMNFLSYISPIAEELVYTPVLIGDDNEVFTAINADLPVDESNAQRNFKVVSQPIGGTSGYFENVIEIPKPLPSATSFTLEDYTRIYDSMNDNSLILSTSVDAGSEYLKVEEIINKGNGLEIQVSHPLKSADSVQTISNATFTAPSTITIPGVAITVANNDKIYHAGYEEYYTVDSVDVTSGTETVVTINETLAGVNGTILLYTTDDAELVPKITNDLEFTTILSSRFFEVNDTFDAVVAYPGSEMALNTKSSMLISGDTLLGTTGNTTAWLSIGTTENAYGQTCTTIEEYADEALTSQITGDGTFIEIGDMFYKDGSAATGEFVIQSSYGDIEKNVPVITGTMAANKLSFKIANANMQDIEIGQFIVATDSEGTEHLTKVINKSKVFSQSTGIAEYLITVNEPAVFTTGSVSRYLPITDFAENLQPTFLKGFTLTESHLPKNNEQQEKIYGVIESTNIGATLKDKQIIQFRYVVDTMEGVISPNMGPKTILTKLAKARGTCLAFINSPSVEQFSASTDPRFTELPDVNGGNPMPIFNPEYVASGGNLTLGPSFKFSLPTEELGSKYCAVFFPNLILRENNKNISVPPAADVSNNFIMKFVNGSPYKIVAGEKRGVISNANLVGTEYELLLDDRKALEPFGLNLLIPSKKVGTMIYTNNLAYQKTVSPFNNLHVRDLLITIEDNIEQILSAYVWEFNDAPTRLEIKSLVDKYLGVVKGARGIYDFLTVMNAKNNTAEIIGQSFGIIDIGIEPAYGLQKVINRLSILKPGTISSGGFTIA